MKSNVTHAIKTLSVVSAWFKGWNGTPKNWRRGIKGTDRPR